MQRLQIIGCDDTFYKEVFVNNAFKYQTFETRGEPIIPLRKIVLVLISSNKNLTRIDDI